MYRKLPDHLQIALDLVCRPMTVTALAEVTDSSIRLVKSNIARLRDMGCQIDSIRIDGAYHYQLTNKDQVIDKIVLWADLEQKQTFLSA